MSRLRRSAAPTIPIPHRTLAEVAAEAHARLALLTDLRDSLETTGVARDVEPELMERLRAVGS